MSPSFSDKTDLSLLRSVFVRFLSVTRGCLGFDRSFLMESFLGLSLSRFGRPYFDPIKTGGNRYRLIYGLEHA